MTTLQYYPLPPHRAWRGSSPTSQGWPGPHPGDSRQTLPSLRVVQRNTHCNIVQWFITERTKINPLNHDYNNIHTHERIYTHFIFIKSNPISSVTLHLKNPSHLKCKNVVRLYQYVHVTAETWKVQHMKFQSFVESCVDFEVAHLSILTVQRLPYQRFLP